MSRPTYSLFLLNWKYLLFLSILWCHSLRAQIGYEEAFPNLRFNFPVEIVNAGDGSNRLFVVEQTGQVKVFPDIRSITEQQQSVFLDISQKISYNAGQEIGLLGLAFHPNYAQNGYFFVYYTSESSIQGINTEIILARFQVSQSNPNLADPESELIIFSFDKNQADSNHNGGKIAFGPDGYLYISIGDGGGAGDPNVNAQNLENVFGAMLRIDVDLNGDNPLETNADLPDGNYEIPVDNPLVNINGLDELYAWGLRNTWKFSFDQETNRIWGSDVGQDNFEEVNLITKGGNYGWNRYEANIIEDQNTDLITTPDLKPIFSYNHDNGDVSITGGYVYRGTSNEPLLNGRYIYGDYASGRVWSMDYDAENNIANSELLFRTNGQYISSFGINEAGELYFSDYGSSVSIYKITGDNNGQQTIAVNGIGTWENLENGINGTVQTVAITDLEVLYVGGLFSSASGVEANNLAQFDAQRGWVPFGTGTNGKVNTIAISNAEDIYVGGEFTEIDGVPAGHIAHWNGSIWNTLGSGTNGPVAKIVINKNGDILVGGAFETADGVTVNNIAVYSNGNWEPLRDSANNTVGTNNEVRAIAIDDNNTVYIGGNFDTAGGRPASRIATWNGSEWGTLGEGTSGFVQAIVTTARDIYVGGNFSIAGGLTVNRLAAWNRASQNWQPIGLGLSGNINDLVHDGNYLYAGGSFVSASDITDVNKIVNNIARWSAQEGWTALGTNLDVGVSAQVNVLNFSPDTRKLYVGGTFSEAGSIIAPNIAYWFENEEDNFPPFEIDENYPNPTSNPEMEKDIIFPNPFENIINIRLQDSWNSNISVTLFSISGSVIISEQSSVENGTLVLETPYLVKGIYFLLLQAENKNVIYKVIKN